MTVRALVECTHWGDDDYRYLYIIEDSWNNNVYNVWRWRFVRNLLAQGIVCTSFKDIKVEYVRD